MEREPPNMSILQKKKTLGEEKKTTLHPKLLIVKFFVEPNGVGPFQFSLHVTPTN
jgi:hypothetical protein